jgi:hypothetical protein
MIRNVAILEVTFSRHVHRLIALRLCPFCGLSLRLEVQNFLNAHIDGAVSELLKRPAGRFDAFGGSLSRVSSIALTGPQGPGIKAATVN